MTTHNTQREVEELADRINAAIATNLVARGEEFGDPRSRREVIRDELRRAISLLTRPSVDKEFVKAARRCRDLCKHAAGFTERERNEAADIFDAALASVEGNAERRNCTDDHGDGDDENENCTCSCHNAVPAVKGEAVADSDVEAAIKAFVAAYEATGKRVTCWQFTDADRAGIRAILLSKCAPRVDVRQLMRDYLGEWAPDKLGDHHVAAMTAALAKQSIPTAEVAGG